MQKLLRTLLASFFLSSTSWATILLDSLDDDTDTRGYKLEPYPKNLIAKDSKAHYLFDKNFQWEVNFHSPQNVFKSTFLFSPNHEMSMEALHSSCGEKHACKPAYEVPTDLQLSQFIVYKLIGGSLLSQDVQIFLEQPEDTGGILQEALGLARFKDCPQSLKPLQEEWATLMATKLAEKKIKIAKAAELYEALRYTPYEGSFTVHIGYCGNLEITVSNTLFPQTTASNSSETMDVDKGGTTPKSTTLTTSTSESSLPSTSSIGSSNATSGEANPLKRKGSGPSDSPEESPTKKIKLSIPSTNFPPYLHNFIQELANKFMHRLHEETDHREEKSDKKRSKSLYH